MASPYTVVETKRISFYDILDGKTPTEAQRAIGIAVAEYPDGKFSVVDDWEVTELLYTYTRPMTSKEKEMKKQQQEASCRVAAFLKTKKEKQEREQLAKLKAKYEE